MNKLKYVNNNVYQGIEVICVWNARKISLERKNFNAFSVKKIQ